MDTEKLLIIQKEWAEKSLSLMRDLLPLMGVFAQSPNLFDHDRTSLGMLLAAAARSTESAFLLIAYGQLWDAEIVIRSVFEASLKFAFIVQTPEEFHQKLKEFAEDQFDLAILKDDKKARDLLAGLQDAGAPEWRPFRDMVISDIERVELGNRYDKTTRRSMTTRWGYAGILGALERSGDPFYKNFSGLSFSYSMASHIQHADYVGISMPSERANRSCEGQNSVHLAHMARLFSDCFTCFLFRLMAAYRFADSDLKVVNEAAKKIEIFMAGMGYTQKQWIEREYGDTH